VRRVRLRCQVCGADKAVDRRRAALKEHCGQPMVRVAEIHDF
jgi:hypothetical protein